MRRPCTRAIHGKIQIVAEIAVYRVKVNQRTVNQATKTVQKDLLCTKLGAIRVKRKWRIVKMRKKMVRKIRERGPVN